MKVLYKPKLKESQLLEEAANFLDKVMPPAVFSCYELVSNYKRYERLNQKAWKRYWRRFEAWRKEALT